MDGFRLPETLQSPDDDGALSLLRRYYGQDGLRRYTGAEFDAWDSSGTRQEDRNRFTADDLVAVSFLAVPIPAEAAIDLLRDQAQQFADLLQALGDDRDLADMSEPLADDWVGWTLMAKLKELDGIGPTRASKLLARKRPKLRPIYDDVVTQVTNTVVAQWEPVRQALCADGRTLHRRLMSLKEQAGLPASVPAIRVLDVIAWVEGKDKGL